MYHNFLNTCIFKGNFYLKVKFYIQYMNESIDSSNQTEDMNNVNNNEDQIKNEEVVPVKKKRGRKPKLNKEEKPKVLKKRGRKPTGRIVHIKNYDISNVEQDENCIIAHIPLNQLDIDNVKSKYITNSIESTELSLETNSLGNNDISFNDKYISHIEEENKKLKHKIKELQESNKSSDIFYSDYSVEKLDSKVIINNKFDTLDENYLCWWCCHKFENTPFFLPDKYYENKYHVFGYFCSPSCACAYNIDMNDYKLWERNSLIIKLYNELTDNVISNVSPSPPKQILKSFGGNITIEEYRKKTNTAINYSSRFIIPPMVPLKTLIEESYKDRNKYKWSNKVNLSKYNNLKKNINNNDIYNNISKGNNSSLEKIMGIKKIKIDT